MNSFSNFFKNIYKIKNNQTMHHIYCKSNKEKMSKVKVINKRY